jgi:hypothetical protein
MRFSYVKGSRFAIGIGVIEHQADKGVSPGEAQVLLRHRKTGPSLDYL